MWAYENVELPLIYRGMSRKKREPLVLQALDSKTGVEILNIFKGLNEQGRTIILITHDLAIAHQSKRVVYFRDGKLNEVG